MGAKQLAGIYCQVAEEQGFARDLCAFHMCFLGCAASEERDPYLERLFEPPDFIVASNYPCMSESHSFLYSVNRFDCPYFFLDAPINTWGKDAADYAVEYYVAQLKELLAFLEQHGYKMDWEKLKEAVGLSQRLLHLWREIEEYRKAVPCPMGPNDGFNAAFPLIMLAGTKAGVELLERFRDELKLRVENKMGVVTEEKLRLLLMGVPPFYNLGLLDYPEKYGAIFVKCMVEYIAGGSSDPAVMDPDRPLESLARKALTDLVNPTAKNMIDFIVKSVKEFHIDGVIELNKRGCRLLPAWLRLIKDAVFEETGVPTAIFDLDGLDLRDYNDAQVKANIDSFIETLLSR
jgi:benzoyl-CoA reductase/2-hydroxyglutaryl-CoA dehydratase subunit BcrC/BadD/HgdB